MANTVLAPFANIAATGKLSMYPPSSNMLPSSHKGGSNPARDIDARTYRHAYPLVCSSILECVMFVVLQKKFNLLNVKNIL
jgi:hypothetical protein